MIITFSQWYYILFILPILTWHCIAWNQQPRETSHFCFVFFWHCDEVDTTSHLLLYRISDENGTISEGKQEFVLLLRSTLPWNLIQFFKIRERVCIKKRKLISNWYYSVRRHSQRPGCIIKPLRHNYKWLTSKSGRNINFDNIFKFIIFS